MKMNFLSGGRLQMKRHLYYPGAAREETFELPVICALVRHPQGNVLFDSGCHPDYSAPPEGRWGELPKYITPIFERNDTVDAQLPRLGLGTDDVDLVICSHLHFDHCGCNTLFPKATVLCHAAELAAAKGPDAEKQGYFALDWDHRGRFQTIDAAHDVFGDGRLTLLPVPGHTVGTLALHVVLERDGQFLLASDAVPVLASLRERYAPRSTWNEAQCLASLDAIARVEKDGATVIGGHDVAQWQSLRTGANDYA